MLNYSRSRRIIKNIFYVVFLACFFCAATATAFASSGKIDVSPSSTACISIIYGVVCSVSLILLICQCCLIKDKDTRLNLLFVSVLICNIGYFALSISRTLEEALLANRIAYLGSVFLILFMLMIIVKVCNISYPSWLYAVFVCISIGVFLIAASGGYCGWYYESASLEIINGVSRLVKVYGPLHWVYYVYLLIYFLLMIAAIIYSLIRKTVESYKYAVFLAAVVFGNIGIWLIEQLIDMGFEFLSVSYVISEMLLLLLYGIIQDYSARSFDASEPFGASGAFGSSGTQHSSDGSLKFADYRLDYIIGRIPQIELLTSREMEVFEAILKNMKRKDIADELGVTEHTVKKHTSHIFEKLEVSSRRDLFEKLRNR
ncbi:MAG: LuxR C-terminal-related transcriptional regulator [Bacillota bacterium]|nr:LuxR C-terminal-related transcriptional regulator [Bacillota bacterium]